MYYLARRSYIIPHPCRLTALVLEILSEIKSQSRDLQRQMQIPQDALDKAAIWLTNQKGVVSGAAAEAGNINNKIFEVGSFEQNIPPKKAMLALSF